MASNGPRPPRPSPEGRSAASPKRSLVRRLVVASLLPLSIAVVVMLLVLTVVSYRVAARFEARELESPTRILGRAVVLQPGALISAEDLVGRLRRMGYRQVKSDPSRPGEFRPGPTLSIHVRAYEGVEGPVLARAVRVRHSGSRIRSVEDIESGEDLEEGVALEPETLTTLYGSVHEDRTVLPLAEFPRHLVDAVLVTEDQRFYKHLGIDPAGMARAMLTNVRSREIKQGGSTLTQQLAKNLYFDQRRTWSRKASEAVVAMILEAQYSKDRLLQAYLNEVYLGQRGAVSIRGFAQAASFYFGKDVRFLDLSESAALAGLIRAPGVYNPFVHLDRCVERRDQVLAALQEEGKITEAQLKEAEKAKVRVRRDAGPRQAPARGLSFVADHVRQTFEENSGGDFTTAGLRIFTTIDAGMQRMAEEALSRGLTQLERTYTRLRRKDAGRRLQGGLVVMDPHDGSVLALVGGRDYAANQFNHITQARRQPGSLFKPFVYLAGYEDGIHAGWGEEPFTPATQLDDSPIERKVGGKLWAPANYDNEFRGPVTAQMALEQSLNVPTVRAAERIGMGAVIHTARRSGIASELKPYASLALGAQEVTPLEIASAYAAIANGGVPHEPVMIRVVRDGQGRAVSKHEPKKARPAVSPQAAYLVTVALQGAFDRGTAASARALGFTGTAAGKTGTTDDYRDAWFAGFTPDLLALVWVGYDDGASIGLTGAQAALPIWVDFIEQVGAETNDPFVEPSGIVWEKVDPLSGGLARWSCDDTRWMAFAEGAEPTEKCSLHGGWFDSWWGREDRSSVE